MCVRDACVVKCVHHKCVCNGGIEQCVCVCDLCCEIRASQMCVLSPFLTLSSLFRIWHYFPYSYVPMHITVLSFLGFHKENMYEGGYVGLSHLCLQAVSKTMATYISLCR